MPPSPQVYLGNGVYVALEPGQLVLTTEDGLRTTNRIVLDADVLGEFIAYVRLVVKVGVEAN